ncbi:Aste57867_2612 [Aphanomyces stellatus]|uniref:Aste57867_2612 protein n=1 Tax=Aphanomyces stellatus TaxID=120398 RepID=A0A485K8P2_9STRA|nr:hypothetical protein As57867_002605 [Aphanomyces stellatus]VFT79808.1 Aste57867_2612 [Aphanomyces stellatus]
MQASGTFSPKEAESFVSFSRFECCHEGGLAIGQEVPYSVISSNAKSPDNEMGEWTRNVLNSRHHSGEPPLTYFINLNAIGDQWHYGWKGGASKVLRNTKHVFKVDLRPQKNIPRPFLDMEAQAYLFQAKMVPGRDTTLQVVGVAQSQPFTVSSFRRSASATAAAASTSVSSVSVGSTALAATVSNDDIPSSPVSQSFGSSDLSIRFVQCTCPDTFKDSYIRCNKTAGRKELRCFPHCCPAHKSHSNCGSKVAIEIAGPLITDIPAYAFVAFARVELATSPTFQMGQFVAENSITPNCHDGDSDWVHGVLLPPSTYRPTALTFQFNELTKQGWPYNWKGNASKESRTKMHVWKGYMLQRQEHHTDPSKPNLRVVGMLQSSPFSILSYRRNNDGPTSSRGGHVRMEIEPKQVFEEPDGESSSSGSSDQQEHHPHHHHLPALRPLSLGLQQQRSTPFSLQDILAPDKSPSRKRPLDGE